MKISGFLEAKMLTFSAAGTRKLEGVAAYTVTKAAYTVTKAAYTATRQHTQLLGSIHSH